MPVIIISALLCCELAVGKDRVVCYFINWAWYRGDEGKFTPNDIDPQLCTHINYAFAVLDETTLTLKSSDTWADVDNNFYTQVTGLKQKNSNLKVLISLGGWTDSAGDKYSRLINDPQKRRNFIDKVIPFLKQYNFDGLDVDWEYPGCPQGNCAADDTGKVNFALWMNELRDAFDKQSPRLLLTAAVAASTSTIDKAYDVPSLSKSFDFINVMTYDMHGAYDGKTGHHAQFKKRSNDADPNRNVVSAMQYWNSKGAPKDKLVMGIPAYGRSFRLTNTGNHGLDAPTSGAGDAGEVTREAGFLGYYEICKRLKQGWSKGRDTQAGSYTYSGNQWIGYDEPKDATEKAKWVKENGFGGVMVWDITMDDFKGTCCSIKNPFLNAMNYGLTGKGNNGYWCP